MANRNAAHVSFMSCRNNLSKVPLHFIILNSQKASHPIRENNSEFDFTWLVQVCILYIKHRDSTL